MPLSAIALFPANPRAFYHLTNVLGLDFLALCAERQGATAYRQFRRWIAYQSRCRARNEVPSESVGAKACLFWGLPDCR